jgi:hypothetical protein
VAAAAEAAVTPTSTTTKLQLQSQSQSQLQSKPKSKSIAATTSTATATATATAAGAGAGAGAVMTLPSMQAVTAGESRKHIKVKYTELWRFVKEQFLDAGTGATTAIANDVDWNASEIGEIRNLDLKAAVQILGLLQFSTAIPDIFIIFSHGLSIAGDWIGLD